MNSNAHRLLPPMAMLRCFDAAVRHGGFTRAGEELGLSQSAVSRHIANLEELLGVPLFHRNGRRVALTARGKTFAAEIAPALSAIRQATGRLIDPARSRLIELATLPSFGMRWLAPRLPDLSAHHPQLVVNVIARSDIFNFDETSFTAAIHVGPAIWPGVEQDRLFREVAIPVVAPAIAERVTLAKPEDFLDLSLLVQSEREDAWARWFALHGIAFAPTRPLQKVSHFLTLAQAVAAGAGAALLPSFLIRPELANGSLVTPIEAPLAEERDYALVYPAERLRSSEFRAFRTWIVGQAAAEP